MTRQGTACHDTTRYDATRHGMTRPRHGVTRHDTTESRGVAAFSRRIGATI